MRKRIGLSWAAVLLIAAWAAGPASAAEGRRPHVVLVSYEDEYHSAETLPRFAQDLHERFGYNCTCLRGEKEVGIAGLEQLATADVLVLFVRRHALPKEQMAMIRRYLDAGKPLVALRTASHAFDLRTKRPADWEVWPSFDHDVLGGNYHDHYANRSGTEVVVADGAASHPILAGLPPGAWTSTATLYKASPLASTARVLLLGKWQGRVEPVAWTNRYREGRVFYTSLGTVDDFRAPQFRIMLVNALHWAMNRPVPKEP
jgi:type 1 glutamine amidotransferase